MFISHSQFIGLLIWSVFAIEQYMLKHTSRQTNKQTQLIKLIINNLQFHKKITLLNDGIILLLLLLLSKQKKVNKKDIFKSAFSGDLKFSNLIAEFLLTSNWS